MSTPPPLLRSMALLYLYLYNGCPQVLYDSFTCVPVVCSGIRPRGRMGGLEGRLRMLVRNLKTMKVVCWVDVSASSGRSEIMHCGAIRHRLGLD